MYSFIYLFIVGMETGPRTSCMLGKLTLDTVVVLKTSLDTSAGNHPLPPPTWNTILQTLTVALSGWVAALLLQGSLFLLVPVTGLF